MPSIVLSKVVGMEILISAGHSDSDPGAVANGKKEAQLALDLRDMVASRLRQSGKLVATDGSAGSNQPLNTAISMAKNRFAVEIHFNAASATASGVEAIALVSKRYQAQKLAQAVASVLKTKVRADNGWLDQSKSARGRLGFVNAGGIILEVCFMSNPAELAYYMANSSKVADAIAKTICEVM